MNISQIIDTIHQIEKDIPVHEWSYKGIDLWPIFRTKLYFDLFLKYNFTQQQGRTSFVSRTSLLFKQVIGSLPAFIKTIIYLISDKNTDFVFFADPSYISLNGKSYQRFIDPEIEWLSLQKKSSITFLTAPTAQNAQTTNTTLDTFIPLLIVRILAKIYRKIDNGATLPVDIEIYSNALQKLGIKETAPDTLSSIAKKYWLASRFYQLLLRKISPRAVFIVSYYESLNMALVHACKTLDIPVIDIQHGAINKFHACYGGWPNIPTNGFNTIPGYFSCWNKESADCINEWAQTINGIPAAIIHGNRFMQKILSQKNTFEPVFNKIQNTKNNKFNILLTIQTYYELTPFLQSMLEMSPAGYFWWIRLHPMLNKQETEKIKRSLSGIKNLEYETDKATSHSLYEILPLVNSHVTLNSSVVIEAKQIGVPSIVCEETGYNYYKEEIKQGTAYKAERPEDVIRLISTSSNDMGNRTFPLAENLYRTIGLL